MSVRNTFPIYRRQKEPDAIGLRSAIPTRLIWEKGFSPERKDFPQFLWERVEHWNVWTAPAFSRVWFKSSWSAKEAALHWEIKGQYWDTCVVSPPLSSRVIHGNKSKPSNSKFSFKQGYRSSVLRPSPSRLLCTQQPPCRQGNTLWNSPLSSAGSRVFFTSEVIKTLRLSTRRTNSRVSRLAGMWQKRPHVSFGGLSVMLEEPMAQHKRARAAVSLCCIRARDKEPAAPGESPKHTQLPPWRAAPAKPLSLAVRAFSSHSGHSGVSLKGWLSFLLIPGLWEWELWLLPLAYTLCVEAESLFSSCDLVWPSIFILTAPTWCTTVFPESIILAHEKHNFPGRHPLDSRFPSVCLGDGQLGFAFLPGDGIAKIPWHIL